MAARAHEPLIAGCCERRAWEKDPHAGTLLTLLLQIRVMQTELRVVGRENAHSKHMGLVLSMVARKTRDEETEQSRRKSELPPQHQAVISPALHLLRLYSR